MAVGDTIMAGVKRTLNVADPQMRLHFPGDAAGFDYYHRLLLHKLGGGRWICLTPDFELEVKGLSTRRHIVLGRTAPFPVHIAAAISLMNLGRMSWSGSANLHAFKDQFWTMKPPLTSQPKLGLYLIPPPRGLVRFCPWSSMMTL